VWSSTNLQILLSASAASTPAKTTSPAIRATHSRYNRIRTRLAVLTTTIVWNCSDFVALALGDSEGIGLAIGARTSSFDSGGLALIGKLTTPQP
jgi:hypothetical protein